MNEQVREFIQKYLELCKEYQMELEPDDEDAESTTELIINYDGVTYFVETSSYTLAKVEWLTSGPQSKWMLREVKIQ